MFLLNDRNAKLFDNQTLLFQKYEDHSFYTFCCVVTDL